MVQTLAFVPCGRADGGALQLSRRGRHPEACTIEGRARLQDLLAVVGARWSPAGGRAQPLALAGSLVWRVLSPATRWPYFSSRSIDRAVLVGTAASCLHSYPVAPVRPAHLRGWWCAASRDDTVTPRSR